PTSNMPESVLSVVRLCAVQKLVPELPMRQVSRTLRGVAADDGAVPTTPARLAARIRTVLLICPSDQSRAGILDRRVRPLSARGRPMPLLIAIRPVFSGPSGGSTPESPFLLFFLSDCFRRLCLGNLDCRAAA